MILNKFFLACLVSFFCLAKTTLNGQVQLNLFSYSEFFYSPNQSYDDLKSFYRGYNKSNFSSNLGISIDYKINRQFSISVGLQRVNRRFDCNCVNVIISKSNYYYVGDSACVLKSNAEERILQIPLSVKYSFPSQSEKYSHSLGIGNTLVYRLGRESLLYDDTGSLLLMSDRKFITFFAPEIYYALNARLSKRVSANVSFGIRGEITKQFNHAFFAKAGLGYLFGKIL